MPASETSVINLGAWIGAFPIVYTLAAVAVVAASAVLIEWAAGMIKRGRMTGKATQAQVAGSAA